MYCLNMKIESLSTICKMKMQINIQIMTHSKTKAYINETTELSSLACVF